MDVPARSVFVMSVVTPGDVGEHPRDQLGALAAKHRDALPI
jgi:hypothetical protein